MSQHGYMRHTATPPLSLKSVKNCGSTVNFYLLTRHDVVAVGVQEFSSDSVVSVFANGRAYIWTISGHVHSYRGPFQDFEKVE